tara:strand:+ start:186 stop:1253 length:1068 start_codon:yes stop_codon:yes gene_type:complete
MAYTTIDDPSVYMQTTIYTGNNDSNGKTITNAGNSDLQPDLLWIKNRESASFNHYLVDSSRGENNSVHVRLVVNGTQTEADGYTDNFASDGFRAVNNNGTTNNGDDFVAWQWKANAGTTTAGSSDDTIGTSTHQANTTAGFSIVTYTGEQANKTVKHGLNTALDWLIVKNRDSAKDWRVWFKGFSGTQRLELNNNEARATTNTSWNNTVPGSSVFTLGNDANTNTSGDKFVAYCWHDVQGYSKFGSYFGNGAADGPFNYLGFKPGWLLIKDLGSTEQWQIKDTTRFPDNPNYFPIFPNLANVEGNNTNSKVDFLSNGFKVRNNDGSHNTDGNEYIYAAFAENPIVTSKGVPATAR